MSDVYGGTIHYRCAFDATCVNSAWDDPYPDISKRVRTWVEDTLDVPRDTLKTKTFLLGGSLKEECPPKTFFETLSRNYNTEGLAPTYWGCRLSHPCSEFFYRRWTHDLTLATLGPNSFRIVVVSQYSMAGYLGEEPDPPSAFVPGIVQSLITSRHWECTSGDEILSDQPVGVDADHLEGFKISVLSSTRTCPVVYLSRSQDTGRPGILDEPLAKLLCGAAKVYVAESTKVDPELEKLLGDFTTWNGGIRVYQPGVNIHSQADQKRHRFFTPTDIRRLGKDEVTMQIVRACCRRAQIFGPNDLVSIEAIVSNARRRRLHELFHEAGPESAPELVELAQDLARQNEDLQRDKRRLREENDLLRMDYETRKEEVLKVLEKPLGGRGADSEADTS